MGPLPLPDGVRAYLQGFDLSFPGAQVAVTNAIEGDDQDELSRAVGLGGRARPAASATERARVNVQRRLEDAVARVSEADAELRAGSAAGVHTGTSCCFRP
jgi:hypothetical protein